MRVPPVPHRAARCTGPAGGAGWWPLPRQGGAPIRGAAPSPGTVAVTGSGTARVVPDLMHFGVAVEIVRERAVDAMAAVGATADVLVSTARSLGIAPQDIRGGEVRLECRDTFAPGEPVPGAVPGAGLGTRRGAPPVVGVAGAGPSAGPGSTGLGAHLGPAPSPPAPRLVGSYRAAETFQMTVRRLDYAGPTLEAITKACGPQARITGIAFGVSRPEELRQAARREAYADAFARAEHYAQLAGRRLGRVQSVDEAAPASPHLPATMASATATGCAPPSPGTSDSVVEQVTVHAVFLLT